MRRRRQEIEVFSLSFLDLLSCGLGGMMLLFVLATVIVSRQSQRAYEDARNARDQALAKLERMLSREPDLRRSRNEARSRLEQEEQARPEPSDDRDFQAIEALQDSVDRLRDRLTYAPSIEPESLDSGPFVPVDRTLLFLVDCSGSMLGGSQEEVEANRRGGEAGSKWERAVAFVRNVLSAQGPNSRFRLFRYNDTTKEITEDWLRTTPGSIAQAGDELVRFYPDGGSDLSRAFSAIGPAVRQEPETRIYLLTDALPNAPAERSRDVTVSPERRRELLDLAVQRAAPDALGGWRGRFLVVLLPWEDDPDAAELYWSKLLSAFDGSILVPPARKP